MPSTVLITKFSEDGTTFDWMHEGNSGTNVNCGTLPHKLDPEGVTVKTELIVADGTTKSYYPMAGGLISQQLHKHHLEADTLANVQADAVARNISTEGKTQAQLIAEIISNECTTQGCLYLL